MEKAIIFPHLGIYLSNVGQKITIGNFDIAYYGITIGIAILAGIAIACAEAKHTGQNSEDYLDLALWAVVFAIIGARIYYVVFSWDNYKDNLLSVLNLREGGLAIYGGVIAAVITVIVFAKVRKLSALQLMDTAVLGLIAGQVIGRYGNFFNREAFGEYTDGLFAMQLPLSAVRMSDVTEKMMEHIQVIDGVKFIQVHPTFLYESTWNLCLLLLLLLYRSRKKFQGEVFFLYLFGYGVGRFWIEGLRTDQLLIPGVGLPVSQVLAGVLVVSSAAVIVYMRRRARQEEKISEPIKVEEDQDSQGKE